MDIQIEALTNQLQSRTITVTSACCHLERLMTAQFATNNSNSIDLLYRTLPLILSRLLGYAPSYDTARSSRTITLDGTNWISLARTSTDYDALHRLLSPHNNSVLVDSLLVAHYQSQQQQRISSNLSSHYVLLLANRDNMSGFNTETVVLKVDGMQLLLLAVLSFGFTHPIIRSPDLHRFYQRIMHDYLNFFLPKCTNGNSVFNSKFISTPRGPTSTSLSIASSLSTFLSNALIKSMSNRPSGTADCLYWVSVKYTTQYIVNAFVVINPVKTRMTLLGNDAMIDTIMSLMEKTFVEYRQVSFKQLNYAIDDAAGEIGAVIDVWTAWTAPWTHPNSITGNNIDSTLVIPDDSSEMFDAFWTPYIKNNAVFYFVLGGQLIVHLSVELAGCTVVVDGVIEGVGRTRNALNLLLNVLRPTSRINHILKNINDIDKEQQKLMNSNRHCLLYNVVNNVRSILSSINHIEMALRKGKSEPVMAKNTSPWKTMTGWMSPRREQDKDQLPAELVKELQTSIVQARQYIQSIYGNIRPRQDSDINEPATRTSVPTKKRLADPLLCKPLDPVHSDLPKTYEVELLLPLTEYLSTYLTNLLQRLLDMLQGQRVPVPSTLRNVKINTRWMAAKHNLLFLSLVLLAWYLFV